MKYKHNIRVLHINSYLSNRFFYLDLYDSLSSNDICSHIYVPVSKNTTISEKLLKKNIITSHVYNQLDRVLFFPKIYKIIKDVEKKYNLYEFDILHSHSLISNGLIAYYLSKKYRLPMVSALRGTDYNLFINKIPGFKLISKRIISHLDFLVFISPAYRKKMLKCLKNERYKEKLTQSSLVIPNGINSFWINNKKEFIEIERTKKNIKVLQVGTLTSNKNIMISLKAIKYLNESGSINYSVTFIGDPVSKRLLKNIQRFKFAQHINHLDKIQLLEQIRKHDIFLLPSIKETFGLVYIEAISQSKPIVYSKDEGVDGFFDELTIGEKTDPKNYKSIAQSIKKIHTSYNNYKQLDNVSIHRFSWDRIAEEYKRIYVSIVN